MNGTKVCEGDEKRWGGSGKKEAGKATLGAAGRFIRYTVFRLKNDFEGDSLAAQIESLI